MIEEDRARGAGDRGVEISVLEDDVGRLAAKFERHFLQVARRGMDDQLADFGGTGESYFVDVGMSGQRGARGLAVAGDDVHHALGEAGFHDQLAETQRRKRRLLRRLQDDRAAAASAGPSFHAAISRGKFQGMICPATPTGSRCV